MPTETAMVAGLGGLVARAWKVEALGWMDVADALASLG
jgi:hypothetical protein